jgi:hypothetical protein
MKLNTIREIALNRCGYVPVMEGTEKEHYTNTRCLIQSLLQKVF